MGLWPPHVKSWLIGKDPDAGRDWGQGEKGTTEDEMARWHHQLNGHEFEWTSGVGDGQGGLACCDSWGRKESDTTEQLNWTELMGLDVMILVFWMFSFKSTFSLSSFIFIKRLFSSSSLSAMRVMSSAYLKLLIFLLAILIPACASSSQHFSWYPSSVLALRIPGMGEPGGLPSMGLHRVRHDWSDLASAAAAFCI